ASTSRAAGGLLGRAEVGQRKRRSEETDSGNLRGRNDMDGTVFRATREAGVKLTLIGGSSINTPELFQCLAQRGLAVGEVCLVARTAPKLERVRRFSERLCAELGLPTRVTATT